MPPDRLIVRLILAVILVVVAAAVLAVVLAVVLVAVLAVVLIAVLGRIAAIVVVIIVVVIRHLMIPPVGFFVTRLVWLIPQILYEKLVEILYLIFDYPHKHYTFKYFEV